MTPPVSVRPEVATALAEGLWVVALESTVFTTGCPDPASVRWPGEGSRSSGTPARCLPRSGVHLGVPILGLTDLQIEELAGDDGVIKAGNRLAHVPVTPGRRGPGPDGSWRPFNALAPDAMSSRGEQGR